MPECPLLKLSDPTPVGPMPGRRGGAILPDRVILATHDDNFAIILERRAKADLVDVAMVGILVADKIGVILARKKT